MKGPFAFRRMLEMEDYDHKREVAKLLDRIARLESQVRELEQQRDEAGRRYVQAVGDLHEAQGKIERLKQQLHDEELNHLSDLRKLEWLPLSGGSGGSCYACGNYRKSSHLSTCWLATTIKALEK